MSTQPDGAVDGLLTKIFGRSWKTSLTGLAALACGVASLIPGLPPIIHDICRVALPVLTGSGLMLAKDRGVTGTAR
jgi:hypothetical protein